MKNTAAQKREDYLRVLQKFINLTLFDKVRNPNFQKNNGKIEIHQKLLYFFQSLENLVGDERNDAISLFYEQIVTEFRKRINKKDSVDLMNCYGFSNFRVMTNIFSMLGGSNLNTAFDPQHRDGEILADLVWSDAFPKEIKAYLFMQFFDIFSHVPKKTKTISQKQYQLLIDRYVCEYDYNKVLNIVYQNFGEIE